MIKTVSAMLVASALWAPLAAHDAPAEDSAGTSMTITVDISAPTAAPPPLPSATSSPAPTTGADIARDTDAEKPRPGALPATGGEVALWAAALGFVALAAGLTIRALRRRRA